MRINMSGATAHLEGDWTLAGVTQNNINSLAVALEQIKPNKSRKLQIDCRNVITFDKTGQELLNVWVQCAKNRGVEPELIIPPNNFRYSFKSLGFRCRYTSRNMALHSYATINHRRRKAQRENRNGKGTSQTTSYLNVPSKHDEACTGITED